jgi:hypothetical protein
MEHRPARFSHGRASCQLAWAVGAAVEGRARGKSTGRPWPLGLAAVGDLARIMKLNPDLEPQVAFPRAVDSAANRQRRFSRSVRTDNQNSARRVLQLSAAVFRGQYATSAFADSGQTAASAPCCFVPLSRPSCKSARIAMFGAFGSAHSRFGWRPDNMVVDLANWIEPSVFQ